MRRLPQLRFYFDASVGNGRELESLIRRAADADRELGLREDGEAQD
jgi:ribosome-binding factor A